MEEIGSKDKWTPKRWLQMVLPILAIALLIVFTAWCFMGSKLEGRGQIGDYFGGIMGPFVGLIGAILTFAAFYIQYQANEEQKKALAEQAKEIKKQQAQQRIDRFEQRFFEMLKIHRENAEGMKFVGTPFASKDRVGAAIRQNPREYRHHEVAEAINVEFEAVFKLLEMLMNSNLISVVSPFDRANLAYGLVFAGKPNETKDLRLPIISKDKIVEVHDAFDSLTQRNSSASETRKSWDMLVSIKIWNEMPNAAKAPQMLRGYSSQLSAYYRHLFQMVDQLEKFQADGFTDCDRIRYAKLLRAQFTDEDQLLFYYNSLWQGVGDDWWDRGFITKYKLIKQVPIARIPTEISPVKRLSQHLKTRDIATIQEHLDSTITLDMLQ